MGEIPQARTDYEEGRASLGRALQKLESVRCVEKGIPPELKADARRNLEEPIRVWLALDGDVGVELFDHGEQLSPDDGVANEEDVRVGQASCGVTGLVGLHHTASRLPVFKLGVKPPALGQERLAMVAIQRIYVRRVI